MENPQEELSKLLGLDCKLDYGKKEIPSWSRIYAEIGRLQERANRPPEIIKEYFPQHDTMPLLSKDPVHYHNGIPCRNNPCILF